MGELEDSAKDQDDDDGEDEDGEGKDYSLFSNPYHPDYEYTMYEIACQRVQCIINSLTHQTVNCSLSHLYITFLLHLSNVCRVSDYP